MRRTLLAALAAVGIGTSTLAVAPAGAADEPEFGAA